MGGSKNIELTVGCSIKEAWEHEFIANGDVPISTFPQAKLSSTVAVIKRLESMCGISIFPSSPLTNTLTNRNTRAVHTLIAACKSVGYSNQHRLYWKSKHSGFLLCKTVVKLSMLCLKGYYQCTQNFSNWASLTYSAFKSTSSHLLAGEHTD